LYQEELHLTDFSLLLYVNSFIHPSDSTITY